MGSRDRFRRYPVDMLVSTDRHNSYLIFIKTPRDRARRGAGVVLAVRA
jgi:hypothetical protein